MNKKIFLDGHPTNIPGKNTLKILEKRQLYLIKKVQNNLKNKSDKNSHFINEIRALEKTINFIKWLINNSSKDTVQKTIDK